MCLIAHSTRVNKSNIRTGVTGSIQLQSSWGDTNHTLNLPHSYDVWPDVATFSQEQNTVISTLGWKRSRQ